jgi:hypothetical protein
MHTQKRLLLFSLALVMALLVSAIQPAAVYADDGTPPEGTPTETSGIDPQGSDEPNTDPATPPETEESVSLPEVLEQVPEGTEVVVLNEDGQVEPLATEEAQQALTTSDPFWCPDGGGTIPGAGDCTTSYGTFTLLLAFLDANDTNLTYQQDGTIYVTSGAYAGGEASIDIDGADYGDMQLYSLTLQGGWNSVSQVVDSTSTFSVPLSISWLGGVTLNDVNVTATASGATGADLDTCLYDSVTGLCDDTVRYGTGDVTVNDSNFNGNSFNGLVIDSGGDVILDTVQANGNGLTGAYITAADDDGTGDIFVYDSTFSNNVNGTGLDIFTDGSITLDNVTANSNNDGAILDTTPGTGDIYITDSIFGDSLNALSGNDYTGLNAYSAGNITLEDVDASYNAQDGAYLDALSGTGGIWITDSLFVENGEWGIKALTEEGDVTLDLVTVDGNDVTQIGAFIKTFGGGDVWVEDSDFLYMTDTGLLVVSSGTVNLIDVDVVQNNGDGVKIYSTYTYACFGDTGIPVYVDGGFYEENGFYGLRVLPGPDGTLTFVTPPTFNLNGEGDYLLDLSEPVCSHEGKGGSEEGPGKLPNIVEVPFTGGEPVEQDCEAFSSNILVLPDGTHVNYGCPFEGYNTLKGLNEEDLPGPLGAGADFIAGLSLGLLDPDQAIITINEDGTLTITFLIPEGSRARGYDILYWDPAANNGAGAWVTLPQHQFGQRPTALNPDDPMDGRRIKSGVRQKGDSVSVTVNFTGVFVLVAR